jgi:hypothetical protein
MTPASASAAARRRRPPPPPPPLGTHTHIVTPFPWFTARLARLQLLVDLARKDGGEFIRETFHATRELAGVGGELVVGDNRRNSGDKADRGGKQRFGDTGRDDRKVGRLRTGDRLERGHDTDDRTEEADERTGRTDRRQRAEAGREEFGFTGERHVHGAVDTHLQADRRPCAALERLLPFAHGGDEDRGEARVVALGQRAEEFFQRLARPEHLLELVELAPCAAEGQIFVDDDRPGPDGGCDQPEHDQFDDETCLHEQRPQADVRRAAANPTCSIDPKSPNPNARHLTGRHKVISQEVSGGRRPKPWSSFQALIRFPCRQIWSKEGVHRTNSDNPSKTLLWLIDSLASDNVSEAICGKNNPWITWSALKVDDQNSAHLAARQFLHMKVMFLQG